MSKRLVCLSHLVSIVTLLAGAACSVERIEDLTGTTAPAQLKALKNATPRFTGVCTKEEMEDAVYSLLGIE